VQKQREQAVNEGYGVLTVRDTTQTIKRVRGGGSVPKNGKKKKIKTSKTWEKLHTSPVKKKGSDKNNNDDGKRDGQNRVVKK